MISDGLYVLLAMIIAAIIAFLLGRLLSKGGGKKLETLQADYDSKNRDYSHVRALSLTEFSNLFKKVTRSIL